MDESLIESRKNSLKTKRICRFCMSQSEPLSQIYSKENRFKSSAPLPLQVMACVSIEVFTNDGMPSTICLNCRMLMEHCYRFKQICKKSDTALRQYPLTGVWPEPLEIPKMPDELLHAQNPKILNTEAKYARPLSFSPPETKNVQQVLLNAAPRNSKPVILNKNSVKILNKIAKVESDPILSNPVIKKKEDGAIEVVSEILESSYFDDQSKKSDNTPGDVAPVETNVFSCSHCERSFPLQQLLDIHLVNHTRERCFECTVCQKRFFSKYDLGKHNLIHTGEKPYQCVVCAKAFTRSTLLHRHEKIHTNIPKYNCSYCNKPFLSVDELEKHTERHKKNRPFSCKICDKSFAFKQGLERHEIVHAKEQPFPCQYCELSFPTPSKLSRHLTAHAGSRPFPCKLCPKSYLLSHHLTRHMRSHKEGSGSYKCYDCEKTFTTRDDLIYHSAVHATQTLVCPLCKEHFDDLDLVTEHIRLHAEGEQYACEFCDLIFMTAAKLTRHSDAEHSDDLAVYERLDMSNIKEDPLDIDHEDYEEVSGEVLHEFVIEEYQHDNDEIQESIDIALETGNDNSMEEPINSSMDSQKATRTKFKEERNSDSFHLTEIEADVDDEIEEPEAKRFKKRGNNVQLESSKINKNKSLGSKTVTSVLKQIPKSVTVMKKEKTEVTKEHVEVSDKRKPIRKVNSDVKIKEITVVEPKKSARIVEKSLNKKPEKVSSLEAPKIEEKVDTSKKMTRSPNEKQSNKLVEMVIGNKKVKVQKITMPKAEAERMEKEGRIKMENGAMILKQEPKKTIITKKAKK